MSTEPCLLYFLFTIYPVFRVYQEDIQTHQTNSFGSPVTVISHTSNEEKSLHLLCDQGC